jgi:hypothetical protein
MSNSQIPSEIMQLSVLTDETWAQEVCGQRYCNEQHSRVGSSRVRTQRGLIGDILGTLTDRMPNLMEPEF